MLQRDYIMRLLREFFAALARTLEKKEISDRREQLQKLYDQYVGPYSLYHNATIDEVMNVLGGIEESQRLYKMEILAELYYAEADTVGQPTRDRLLDNAFQLFTFIEQNGDTYSIERQLKMRQIAQILAEK